MKKLFLSFMMFAMLVPMSVPAQDSTSTVIDEVATTLNTKLDSATFIEYKQKIESLESTIEEMRATYDTFKDNKVNTTEDYENLYSIIMAFLTSILTFFQRQGWLKNVKQGILVVIGTALALVLALTAFKGDWNAWSFVKDWFVASGGGVLAWELFIKHVVNRIRS